MARLVVPPVVYEDFDRFLRHLERYEVSDAPTRIMMIIQALDILTHSPLIGRPVKAGRRELVIGRDAQGYVALYRDSAPDDLVVILAIRSQREAGYQRDLSVI